jgi:Sec7-like guanine-nucleotide exchange factor
MNCSQKKNQKVLKFYLEMIPMNGLGLEASLRRLLARFKLPGEAQQIDRLIESFAEHYHECNPSAFPKSSTAYVLSFSMILLNTDLHNPNNPRKMTKEVFITNSKSIEESSTVDDSILSVFSERSSFLIV